MKIISSEGRAGFRRPIVRGLALVILLTASARIEPLSSAVLDPDLWWHLRDADYVLTHHQVPHASLFTQYSNRAYVDYSWGSEIIISRFYHWFGLIGIVALRSTVEVLITIFLFLLLRRKLRSFWQALPLAAAGMWAIHHCLGMQPMLFSILMFVVELSLIFEARRKSKIWPLWCLPPLFLLWANLHIQFIYGLFVLFLLAAARLVRAGLPVSFSSRFEPLNDLPSKQVLGSAAASALATLVGPYSWRLYAVIFGYVRSSAPYAIITELQALTFRAPEHYVLLLIVAGSFFALGWRRSRDPFLLSLLIACTVVGFRMTRDSWFCCLPALAIIGDRRLNVAEESPVPVPRKLFFAAAIGLATAIMFVVIAWDTKTNNESLARVVASEYPAQACDFLRSYAPRSPLYNDMNWGGFLVWALPDTPVAIDNRTDLYGDQRLSRFYLVQRGMMDWRNDPDLSAARVVLLSRNSQLAALLVSDSRFHLIYEDSLAVILSHDEASARVSHAQSALRPVKQTRMSSR